MAQEFGITAPRAEEMTKVVAGIAGAGITGVVEGATVQFAKGMGALEPIFSWGVLLGAPAVGIAGALFTRGMIGDLFQGVAAGGSAILGYSLPAMLLPEMFGRKGPAGRGQLGAGPEVKQLTAGLLGAPLRAQQSARIGIEF